jgi:hypothetical protein
MMEAASTSEMSVNFYQTTWGNNPEDSQPPSTSDIIYKESILSYKQKRHNRLR